MITNQAPLAGDPGETVFDHPAAGRQREAAFGLGVFDDFQLNAVLRRRLSGILAGVALIHTGQLDVIPGELLYRLG